MLTKVTTNLINENIVTLNEEGLIPEEYLPGYNTFVKNFTGDGTTTTFDLETENVNTNLISVYFNGVYQQKDTFSVISTNIVFDNPPLNDVSIEITGQKPLDPSSTYLQPVDIGVSVQSHSDFLDSLAALPLGTTDQVISFDGSGDPVVSSLPNVYVETIADLRSVDINLHSVARVTSEESDVFDLVTPTLKLQSQMVVKTVSVSNVNTSTDTFRMQEIVTATFNAVTNTFTSNSHPFVALQQVIIPTTRNQFQGGGLYYIGNDVTANTFRLYTSVGTATIAGTSGLVQIGVKSTSVISNTIAKLGHGWADGTLVRVAEAVNGLSTSTDYYIKTDNVNNYKLSLTPGGPDVVLTGTDPVITYQPGNMTIRQPHNMFTGEALVLDSDPTANPLYFIAVDQCYGKLATSYENAMSGVTIDLTDSTPFTFYHLSDPREGRWIIPTGKSRIGTDSVWQRATSRVEGRHFGVVADALADRTGTDNSAAVQAAIRLAYYLGNGIVYFGSYKGEMALKYPVGHWTHSNISVGGDLHPKNGIVIQGEGSNSTKFCVHADSTNQNAAIILDGNTWAVSHVVGSNPMNQGYTELRGFALRGPGQNFGGTLSGLKTRGIWRMGLYDVYINNFPRDGWEVFSAAPAGPPANDDVDSTALITSSNLRLMRNGRNGKSSIGVRTGVCVFNSIELQHNLNCGAIGAWIQTTYINPGVSRNGSRSITTSGGMRYHTSTSGAIPRDITIINGVFENNFNFEISIYNTRNFRMYGGGLNLYAPSDASVNGLGTNQSAIYIGTGNTNYVFEGQIFTNNVTAYGDIWCFNIATTSPHGSIRQPYFAGASSHIQLQSGNDVEIKGCNVEPDITLTGAAPVDCFVGNKPLGSISDVTSLTPVLAGLGAAGTKSGGIETGSYLLRDNRIEFSVNYSQDSHTGTGGISIVLNDLPRNFVETVPVELYFEGLTYTSPPMALAISGTKLVYIRQAASGASQSSVAVPAGSAIIRLRGSVR